MATLYETSGGPVNETELAIIKRLVDELPDDYGLLPNVIIDDPRRGQPFEYDAVVLAPHGVFAVEIKGWGHRISTINNDWWQLATGKQVKNPLGLIRLKAQVLASLLKGHDLTVKGSWVRTPWVQHCVVLGSDDIELDLIPDHRNYTLRPREIVDYLQTPVKTSNGDRTYAPLRDDLARLIKRESVIDPDVTRVFGSYRVIDEIERTDDGVIYTAKHTQLDDGQLYRIRTWHVSPYRYDEKARQRRIEVLKRGAEALQRIGDHRNFAKLAYFGELESTFFEVTTFSEYGTLATSIAKGLSQRLDADAKLRLLLRLCRGLEAAHAAGVHHRHLDSGAIVLTPDGQPQLTAFEWAFVEDATHTVFSQVADDTPNVLRAPELRSTSDYEVYDSTDLYGLAIVAYDLFSGELPRRRTVRERGETRYEWLPLSEMTELPGPIRDDLDGLLLSMLAEDPDERPQNPTVARDRLQALFERLRPPDVKPNGKPKPKPGPEPTADTFDFAPGDVIDGVNEVLEVLGRGAKSVVYRVRNDVLLGEFALKLVAPGDDRDPSDPIRQCRLLRQLEHPGLVRAHWAGRVPASDGSPGAGYVLLEVLEGPRLDDYLAERGGHLPVADAVELAVLLLDALAYLHTPAPRLGRPERPAIVHRDLKPENVVLTATGRPVIADFSSAAALDEAGHAPIGTLRYTPPDLAERGWDASGDLFAVACLTQELLTGRHPWGDGVPSLERPPEPADRDDGVPHALAQCLGRALDRRRDDGFDSAEAFAEALRSALIAADEAKPPLSTRLGSTTRPEHGQPSEAIWSPALVRLLARSDDPTPALAERLWNDLLRPSPDRDAFDGFVDAERRAFELERPLPETTASIYDRLASTAAPVALDGGELALPAPDEAASIVLDGLHPYELNAWRGSAERLGLAERAGVWRAGPTDPGRRDDDAEADEGWQALSSWWSAGPAQAAVSAPEAGAAWRDGTRRLRVGLPPGRGAVAEDLVAARLEAMADLADTVLADLAGSLLVTATFGSLYLGHGLRDDVARGAGNRAGDAVRSAWTTRFADRRVVNGAHELPSTRLSPYRVIAGRLLPERTFAVGRFGWPEPPDAPRFASGGLSLLERLLPVIIFEAA